LASVLMALGVMRWVPADPPLGAGQGAMPGAWGRLRRTLSAPGPWLVALTFGVYSGQWLAVVGFLPSIYAAAGVAGGLLGLLTALAAAVNMLGKPFKNSEMLHNIPLKVRVTMGKRTDNGEDENRLRFLSINEVSAPVATAPAAAWSQASASPSAAATGNAPKKKPWEK
jgi:hypothetical protein